MFFVHAATFAEHGLNNSNFSMNFQEETDYRYLNEQTKMKSNNNDNDNDNVITLPNGAPARNSAASEPTNDAAKQQSQDSNKPLTMAGVNQLGGALHRLHELRQQVVLNADARS